MGASSVRVSGGGCCLPVQPRILPGIPHPEPWATPGREGAWADSQVLPSPSVRMNCLSERRCIVCYYSLSLKKSLKQEDGKVPNARAEPALAAICGASSPGNALGYADGARRRWADAGPSQHKITAGRHLTW